MRLLFERLSKIPFLIEKGDIVPIKYRNSFIPYKWSNIVNNHFDSWKSC